MGKGSGISGSRAHRKRKKKKHIAGREGFRGTGLDDDTHAWEYRDMCGSDCHDSG